MAQVLAATSSGGGAFAHTGEHRVMIDRNDVQWYRDAIIYQLHVKSFFDSDNDGAGDFPGLTQKLDYIRDLGATAIWLMPFYPSPLRDDGYDISNYRGINPAYGSQRDFKRFVREAHERGLRVIIELVINHTSDQHPWFKRARAAKPGSAARNFYVWADNDQGYKDAPIIFLDSEKSNWTWDEEAKAFYWHRFYAHQPDLNFDNPRVLDAVLDVMRFWLDMGVDGLRLDAIPYLVEREGTACENLPETHAIARKIRAAVDAAYPDRMLLAEANLWPEETAQYFGDGDECHMAFHFPLMPRIYMALAQEDRHPITDILRQTPEIPDGAQWAIFLRNHDEMTLAMVTSRERDYLWSFYAADQRARINLGIRRRLAPLLENDRRKIELLNSLLLSMPGTPIIYYGDEIGMGDNIYLGDRDGVRTPMQWSVDRNGGFSRADPAKLFLPVIQDPVYGYSAKNVEAQLASPSSLLTWMRRMIVVRRSHQAFGRGNLRFLYPSNRKVLAYLREFDSERILCVVNVSRAPQAVELDLAEFRGAMPVELTAGSLFPPIGAQPYLLTLPAFGFFWFRLEAVSAEKDRLGQQPPPELFTLVATGKLETILSGRELVAFERNVAPRFLVDQRWFAAHGARIDRVRVKDFVILREKDDGRFLLPIIAVELSSGEVQAYFTPLAAEQERDDIAPLAHAIAKLRRAALMGFLYDGEASPGLGIAVLAAFRRHEKLATAQGGAMIFVPTKDLGTEPEIAPFDIHPIGASRRHSCLVLASQMMLKVYRRLQGGIHPEVEILRHLTETAHFTHTPPLLGTIDYLDPEGGKVTLAALQTYARNQGDAWTWTLEALKRILESLTLGPVPDDRADEEEFSSYVPYMRRLGERTAEMHKALAMPTDDPAFEAERLSIADLRHTLDDTKTMAEKVFARLKHCDHYASDDARILAERLLSRRTECLELIATLAIEPIGAIKTRIHGDYHLRRALIVKDDVMIVGFGGEGFCACDRTKQSPLVDVASMLCSFAYAAGTARRDLAKLVPDPAMAGARLHKQLIEFSQIFVGAYMDAARGTPIFVEDRATRRSLLILHVLHKAFQAINAEAQDRQECVEMPIEAVHAVLDYVTGGQ
jgi:maltose alpha-D-glucosyltransferase/alpha-amylase